MFRKNAYVFLLVAIVGLFAGSCGDDGTGPTELVTIARIVRNVDNGTFAPGVRVRLYGTSFSDEVATGSDGAYSLRVPLGSKLQLITDDFDSAIDTWFPTLNVDAVPVFANHDLLDWPIHACANAAGGGSVAAWDNFLAHADDTSGNRFVPATSTQSGGIISIIFAEGVGGARILPNLDSMVVASNSAAFPNGFARLEKFFNATGPDPSLGPDILFPNSRTFTDAAGAYFSFGDPANTSPVISLQVSDASGRVAPFSTPWEIPVAPGMISMVITGTMNGVMAGNLREFACWAHMFPCAP